MPSKRIRRRSKTEIFDKIGTINTEIINKMDMIKTEILTKIDNIQDKVNHISMSLDSGVHSISQLIDEIPLPESMFVKPAGNDNHHDEPLYDVHVDNSDPGNSPIGKIELRRPANSSNIV